VVDEAQDLTESYFKLIQRIRGHLHKDHKILLVGDRFQNIFQCLQNSSPKYLDSPSDYFEGEFKRLNLSYSFRATPHIADWVNKNLSPFKLQQHYPEIWAKEGKPIGESWG